MQVLAAKSLRRGAEGTRLSTVAAMPPGDLRILLVEDDVKLARVLAHGLEREG